MAASGLCLLGGCLVPQSDFNACQSQNRMLSAQSRAQVAEIQNLRTHTRTTEDQLVRTEQELALLQEQVELDQKRLANYKAESGNLQEQFKGLSLARHLPPAISKQLRDLSARYPNLNFDPATGVSKLDTDVLFDSGQAELKASAQAMLGELAHVLQSPEAGELKVMVVGHTDNQRMTVHDRFPNNFHLSTARALAVADLMRRQGLAEQRIGVAGFGPHQPVVPNASAGDRQKNRRVEIFVMAPDVPVVGWSDSTPSMY
jgi:chemotaxis protein MotB